MALSNLTAYPTLADRPLNQLGQAFDLTFNEGHSACPEGGPAPYGRVLVRGRASHTSTNPALDLAAPYPTLTNSVSLPDKNGAWLKNSAGLTYAAAGIALPVDGDGLLIYAGIGLWTEHRNCLNDALIQPFGLGETDYQREGSQIGMAITGNIWCYCETAVELGDKLYFRTVVTNPTDGIQLLGGFSKTPGANFQAFPHGKVKQGGPAGGAFVLTLNIQN